MGLFGGKDKDQDKTIAELIKEVQRLSKNQQVLVNNNNVFIQNEKSQRSLNSQFTKSLQGLQAEAEANKQRDAQLSKKFQDFCDRVGGR